MKKLLLPVLVLICLLQTTPALAFNDVPEDHWARTTIERLYRREKISGYPGDLFRPGTVLTRAEAAVLLVQAAGLQGEVSSLAGSSPTFRDVKNGHWASPYITLAWEKGYIGGYPDGTFRPAGAVNRMEMASMLLRALELPALPEPAAAFRDEASTPEWARSTIRYASAAGLIGGYPDGTFRPHLGVRRDEATAMVTSFLSRRGTLHDFHGTVSGPAGNRLRIRVGDRTYDMPAGADLLYLRDGIVSRSNPFLAGDPVLGVLDSDGILRFLEEAPEDLSGFQPSYSSRETFLQPQGLSMLFQQSGIPATAGQGAESSRILRNVLGVSTAGGSGETVAIIDTGVDPRLEELRTLPDGSPKLISYVTLGPEGLIPMEGTLIRSGLYATVEGRRYNLSGVSSRSGQIRYGWLEEAPLDTDLNGNGTRTDRILTLLTDSREDGVYDRLYLDLANNGTFGDDREMVPFGENRATYSFPGSGRPVNFVVSSVDPGGESARLGFDLNGHGTMMASAAAGRDSGMAPDSRLIVVKAFDRQGEASWKDLEEAIKVAVREGATVVNLSMGYLDTVTSGNNSLTYLAQIYNQRYGVVFVGAAGNYGPGTQTLATPGNGESLVGVGAYLPAEYVRSLQKHPLEQDSLWPFSSAGPRRDGYLGTDITAPGIGVFPVPAWDAAGYREIQGTSVSSALVSGAVASTLSALPEERKGEFRKNMPRALGETARPMESWNLYETGYGQADFRNLRNWRDQDTGIHLTNWHRELGVGQGIFAREYLPGNLSVFLTSSAGKEELVYWESTASWMKPEGSLMVVPPGVRRTLELSFRVPREPGLYTGFLRASVLPRMEAHRQIPVGVVVPHVLEDARDLELSGDLASGQLRRDFLRVEAGQTDLQGEIRVRRGTASFLLFDPSGTLVASSLDMGTHSAGTFHVEKPQAGTWELVTFSPVSNASGGNRTQTLTSVGVEAGPAVPVTTPTGYFVGNITRRMEDGRQWIGLSVRDQRFQPLDGVMVEMEGRMFEIRDGWINVEVDVSTDAAGNRQIRF